MNNLEDTTEQLQAETEQRFQEWKRERPQVVRLDVPFSTMFALLLKFVLCSLIIGIFAIPIVLIASAFLTMLGAAIVGG